MNGYQNHYRNGPRYERVDQEEVPESKHTLFIRGLPGHIKTDEIKDFFDDHVGPCSFDFIKLSQDQLKIFVAVRFETRDAAKECMHKYKDGEVLGYPIEITWFRDIRRYVTYQQSQGLRPAMTRNRNYESRSRNSYERSSRKDYSSSRSHSRSPRRDRSRSADNQASRNSNARSHSRSRESSVSRAVSNSLHDTKAQVIERGSTPPLPPSPPPASLANQNTENQDNTKVVTNQLASGSQSLIAERKIKKSKKDRKKRRNRTPSSSSSVSGDGISADELSESELRKKILKKREKALKEGAIDAAKAGSTKTTLSQWISEQESKKSESTVLQNTTLKFGLESLEDIPKRMIREPVMQSQAKRLSAEIPLPQSKKENSIEETYLSRSAQIDIFEESFNMRGSRGAKEATKKNMDILSKTDVGSMGSLCDSDIDVLLGKRGVSQSGITGQQAQARIIPDDFDNSMQTLPHGALRLSSLTLQLDAESERESKLAKLSPELLNKYTVKKRQFDAALKADRETFGFVTKTLIKKDMGLEDRLRLALIDAIKDMEDASMQKMDQYLDQLIMFMTM